MLLRGETNMKCIQQVKNPPRQRAEGECESPSESAGRTCVQTCGHHHDTQQGADTLGWG
jgi:hypothetical protein